jgi:RNA polymerase sigma-70 factor (ECF subfamily)
LNYSFHLTKKLKKEEFFHGEMDEDVKDTKLHFEKKIIDSVFMEKVLDTLSINLRTVVVLFYFDELSVRDISEIENISENAVKNRLFQARDKIKTYLKEIGHEGF